MFCPPLRPNAAQQVWPGGGVDLFRNKNDAIKLVVVSSYSKYLNLERWYFAGSAAAAARSGGLRLGHGAPAEDAAPELAAADTPWHFAQSYEDRAILTEIDWNRLERRGLLPYGYECTTLAAKLRPVIIQRGSGVAQRPQIASYDKIPVWVQFWTLNDTLMQIAWIIADKVDGHLPSAFEIPQDDADFKEGTAPEPGWIYSGGLRPAPWPG
jgi:hypothetical protein